MALRTRLGEILRSLNVKYGKVALVWGTILIMTVAMSLFLVITLQVYTLVNFCFLSIFRFFSKAGNAIRTRDIDLGKVALYH
jgi:hypothetical protein